MSLPMPTAVELTATILFAAAIVHTFTAPVFARVALRGGPHSGLWHLLGEVEAVFGLWAFALLAAMSALAGPHAVQDYMDGLSFTEPLFVFVVMVIAGSRPILDLVTRVVQGLAGRLPMRRPVAAYFLILALVPLLGSFITEPAAMTLAAVMLRDTSFRHGGSPRFKYASLAVLFVNVSIGGTLTAYAAPPVLMAASAFGWDSAHMFMTLGWRADCAVLVNALAATWFFRDQIARAAADAGPDEPQARVPAAVAAVHLAFLALAVAFQHHPSLFVGLFLLFVGYTEAYARHQHPLMIRQGLMVGFFLAGLVVLGGMQKWWLQDLLGGLPPLALFWGATALTAVTDNAALTYLGSLVDGTSEHWRTMLVAGAVTGGGLTVIANAPNPAGFALLKGEFPGGTIAPWPLFLWALAPTAVAAAFFLLV